MQLHSFGLLTPSSGWVVLDRQLYLTLDSGQTWKEIGPYIAMDGSIENVEFIDLSTVRVLWSV